MRKTLALIAAAFVVLGIGGYAAGLYTGEAVKKESCSQCRAMRFKGVRYGFPFERIEDTSLTAWYRTTLDPEHGKDGLHPHDWQPSGCPVFAAPGMGDLEAACPSIAPIFFLKPDTELIALKAAPDNKMRRALIASLNTKDRKVAFDRVKLLVEYVYVYKANTSWASWWQRNAGSFGIRQTARR